MTYGTGIYGTGTYGATALAPAPPIDYGPHRPTVVIVDDLNLNDDTGPNVHWLFTKITGWHGGPGVEVDQAQRTNQHGQFGQPGRRTGRPITITGRIAGRDRADVAAAIERLDELLADGQFGRLTFADRTLGPRWVDVQLLDSPDVVWNGGPFATYQLSLLAPGPFKYGTMSTASTGFAAAPVGAGLRVPLFTTLGGVLDFGDKGSVGTLQVRNPGSAPASVRFVVDGPTPPEGFTITELGTDNRITFLAPVPAGSHLRFDTSTGMVTLDGVADRSTETVVTRWPVIPKRGSAEFLFAPIGAPTPALLTAEVDATYW